MNKLSHRIGFLEDFLDSSLTSIITMRAAWEMVFLLVMTRVVAVNTKQLSCSIRGTFIATEGKLEQTLACELREEAKPELFA